MIILSIGPHSLVPSELAEIPTKIGTSRNMVVSYPPENGNVPIPNLNKNSKTPLTQTTTHQSAQKMIINFPKKETHIIPYL
jgi:hypothetical protein